jgi:hypothetical protein
MKADNRGEMPETAPKRKLSVKILFMVFMVLLLALRPLLSQIEPLCCDNVDSKTNRVLKFRHQYK